MTTLGEVGEFGLLAELERRGLAEGIEHDAALVDGLVVTQDALVEGVHFRFSDVAGAKLGFKVGGWDLTHLWQLGI